MASNNVGLKRYLLKELVPEASNAVIVGIIVAKQRPKKFSKSGSERAVWNFTIRDSPYDYINATVWGACDNVFEMNDKFQIGDVSKFK